MNVDDNTRNTHKTYDDFTTVSETSLTVQRPLLIRAPSFPCRHTNANPISTR